MTGYYLKHLTSYKTKLLGSIKTKDKNGENVPGLGII